MDKINYYLYHIPGKKIGVTRDLISRVVDQQGYSLDEVEVLDQSTDINYISDRELELQQSYGYRVDRQKYKDLYINKIKPKPMNINATEQTSTFPVPVSKLKGRLMDDMGKSWLTSHGKFEINMDSIKWIMENVKTSMYTTERCYVYNKAFAKYFNTPKFPFGEDAYQAYYDTLTKRATLNGSMEYMKTDNRFQLIRDWAGERGLYTRGDTKTQFCKLMEEAGELGRAVLKDDQPEFIDAIGDMVVVLTNLAHLNGVTIEDCIDSAYKVISKRTGKMVNGTFVKDEK
ncbi:MazG-like family protein [bacterium]|jgi:NTP pyrophosphatase (non-canonical NTP hydrolase)|nr:MazG-like family protein [bacterium]